MSLNFSEFTLNISAHFEILRGSINDMKLDEFVTYHQKLIDVTQRLSSIYEPMIFTQFFLETTLFVAVGLSIIVADNLVEILSAITFVLPALLDVAILSFGSQKIMDNSMSICDEAYMMDKDYLLVIMMAQKKLRFTTGFFDASFDTYSTMLSRSWSFLT